MALPYRYTAVRSPSIGSAGAFLRGRLPLLFLLAACGRTSGGEAGDEFARSARVEGGREIALSSSLGTAQSGSVNFSAEGDSLLVSVELIGLGAGAHRGFIRHGQSCASPGAAIVELPTITGTSGAPTVATQRVPLLDLAVESAVVVYHEPNQTPGHVILCGLISAESVR